MGLLSTFGAASGRAFGLTRVGAAIKDAYFNLVTLLLPGNGTNGAQNNTFLDSSTNNFTITRNGNTTQGTFSPFSQTGWSNYFDGTDDGLTVANNAGFATLKDSAWTVECWAYANSTSSSACIIGCSTYSTGAGFQIFILSNSIALYANGSGGSNITGSTFPLNQWNHVAAVRNSSGQVALFLNGARQGASNPYTINLENVTTNPLVIGAVTSSNGWNSSLAFNGYISNARVVKGTAVYDPTQSTITVPTSPLTPITNTVLLTCQSNSFIDTNTQVSAKTITVAAGTPSVQAFSPFAPTAAYSAATNGGSGYFDGTGDYLTVADNAAFDIGSSDFLIEAWVYSTSSTNFKMIIGQWNAAGTTTGLSYTLRQNANKWAFSYTTGGTTETAVNGTSTQQLNAWAHLAVIRTGNTLGLFVNGVRETTASMTGITIFNNNGNFSIGGAGNGGDLWLGYVGPCRVIKGTLPSGYDATQSTLTVPTAPFTSTASTSILENFTNAGITDATAKNVLETVGNAQISTTQSKFGGSSMYFDGTGDYLLIPDSQNMEFGSGDFTIELWIYPTATPGSSLGIFSKRSGNSAYGGVLIQLNSSRQPNAFATVNGTSWGVTINSVSSSCALNTWSHIAFTRSGGTWTLWLNGVSVGTATSVTGSIPDNSSSVAIGAGAADGTTAISACYIDDVRVTRYARYTTTFTPPTEAFALQ